MWVVLNLKKLKVNKTEFVPVDSEHFSIFSLINGTNKNNIKKFILQPLVVRSLVGHFINLNL